jgi:ferredoxin
MKVHVNWELCEGHALCTQEMPEVFEMRETDQVTLLDEQPPENLRPQIEAAARYCPRNAISIEG